MQSVGWQGGRAEIPLDTLIPPCASSGPDYARLIEVLLTLRQPLDPESGETILTREEAARIRTCRVAARAGRWRCPLLPDHRVRFLPALCGLSDAIGPEFRQGTRWHRRRAPVLPIIWPPEPLSTFDRRFLTRLARGPIPRRRLQQSLGRDFTVGMFHHILNRLVAGGYAVPHDGRVCLTREGAAVVSDAKRPGRNRSAPQGPAFHCYAL